MYVVSFLVITTYVIRAFGMFSTDEILEKCVIVKGKVCYVNFTQQLLISYLCWNSPRWRMARRGGSGSVKWALNNFIINYPGCPRFSVIYGANFRGWKNVIVQCCQFVYLCESCSYEELAPASARRPELWAGACWPGTWGIETWLRINCSQTPGQGGREYVGYNRYYSKVQCPVLFVSWFASGNSWFIGHIHQGKWKHRKGKEELIFPIHPCC